VSAYDWRIPVRTPRVRTASRQIAGGFSATFENLVGLRVGEARVTTFVPGTIVSRQANRTLEAFAGDAILAPGARGARVSRVLGLGGQGVARSGVADLTRQPFGFLSRFALLGFGVFFLVGDARPTFAVRTTGGALLIGREEGLNLLLRRVRGSVDILNSVPRRAAAGAARAARRVHGPRGVIAGELVAAAPSGRREQAVRAVRAARFLTQDGPLEIDRAGGRTVLAGFGARFFGETAGAGGQTEMVPAFPWRSGPRERFRAFSTELSRLGLVRALRSLSRGGEELRYVPGRGLVMRRTRRGAEFRPFAKFRPVSARQARERFDLDRAVSGLGAAIRPVYAAEINRALGGVREGRP